MVHIRCQCVWRKPSLDAVSAARCSNNVEIFSVLIDFGWDVNEYIDYVGDALMWVDGTLPQFLSEMIKLPSFTAHRFSTFQLRCR
jgi:hypothetical protein